MNLTSKKGMSFGDLSINSKSMHTTTLISQTNVQLLVIERKNFFDIFVHRKFEEASNNSNIKILQESHYFRDWPMNLFDQNPHVLKSTIYERNQIINKDGKYIYFIESGFASVWTKLHLNEPIQHHRHKIVNNFNNVDDFDENDESIFPKNKLLEVHHFDVLNFHDNENLFKSKDESERLRNIEDKMKYNEILDFLRGLKIRERSLNEESSEEEDVLHSKKVIKWAHNGSIIKYENRVKPAKSNKISLPRLKNKGLY